jgi:hypothetical protein
MNRTEAFEDLSTVLYLVPFLAAGVYAIVLWAQSGASLELPTAVYLTVTRDPYLFLIGSFAVFGGVYFELSATDRAKRSEKLPSISSMLQKIAAASFILALASALYANGLDPTNTVLDFIVGRYSLVFPALLVLLSYLIVTPVNTGSLGMRNMTGIVVMFLVPAVIYEVGKRNSVVGISLGFVLLIVGMVLFLWHRQSDDEKTE